MGKSPCEVSLGTEEKGIPHWGRGPNRWDKGHQRQGDASGRRLFRRGGTLAPGGGGGGLVRWGKGGGGRFPSVISEGKKQNVNLSQKRRRTRRAG